MLYYDGHVGVVAPADVIYAVCDADDEAAVSERHMVAGGAKKNPGPIEGPGFGW